MKYDAIVLSESLEGGRLAVKITIESGQVKFDLNEEKFSWFIQQIVIEQGGTGNQLIYIKNGKFPDLVLYTRDKNILKDPVLNQSSSTQNSSKKIRTNILKDRSIIWLVVFLILMIPTMFLFFRSYFIRGIAEQVPVSWEVEAGDKLFSTMQLQYKIVEDSAISAKFDSLFAPLIKAADYDSIDFKFYLCEDASLNAFALPGGHVVINSGTIQKVQRIEELYGVIGHELAHVTERHHIRGLIGNLGTFLIFQGMFGSEAGLIGSLGESAGSLSSLFYSRSFETESDYKGYEYLKEAGIDPHGMVEFFQRIEQEQEEMIGEEGTEALEKLNSFISTHPGTKDRIEYLEKKIEEDQSDYVSQKFDLKKFKQFINSKLEE